MTHILLTNDDGYQAEGLRTLAKAFESFATVSIVAPSLERSGAAQSLTLRQPIVCNQIGEREWAIDGTPADCVIVALHRLLPEKPDMVISGINHGANLGENVYYSGTVGAAREGALHHIPSIAMSLCSKKSETRFENSARVARAAAEMILKEGLPDQVCGRSYFWLFEQRIDKDVEPDTDYAAIFSGAVSITPLHLDPTHTESLNHLSHWAKTITGAFGR